MLLPLPFLCVNGQKSFPVLTLFIKKKQKKNCQGHSQQVLNKPCHGWKKQKKI